MSSSEAAGNAARSVASTVATSVGASLAKHGVSMAREVPGTVAVFAGIAGFGMYMYTCRYICTCAYGVWYVRVFEVLIQGHCCRCLQERVIYRES